MKKNLFFLVCLVVVSFIFVASTWAAGMGGSPLTVSPTPTLEYSLPYPGILPDHPLYFLKTLRDKILEKFTKDPVKKIYLQLLLADKRLAMGKLLWEKGNKDLSLSTLSKGEKYLLKASQNLVTLKNKQDLPPGLADKLELAAKKHEEVISKMVEGTNTPKDTEDLKSIITITHQTIGQIVSVK